MNTIESVLFLFGTLLGGCHYYFRKGHFATTEDVKELEFWRNCLCKISFGKDPFTDRLGADQGNQHTHE